MKMLMRNSGIGAKTRYHAGGAIRAMAMAFSFFGALAIFTASAGAHVFTVLIASPNSGPEGNLGLTTYHGFIIAIAERDAHPNETADGHLGGLDVNVHRFDSAAEDAAQALRERLQQGDIDVFVTVAAGTEAEALRSIAESAGIVTFAPAPLPFDGPPGSAPTASKFAAAFEEHFDVAPDRNAAQAYQTARRIEDAVRPFDSAANTPELRQRLQATANGITW